MNCKIFISLIFILLGIVNIGLSQHSFEVECSVGVTHPSLNHNRISPFERDISFNAPNLFTSIRMYHVKAEKDLFFVQLSYSQTGTIDHEVSNMRFPLDVDNGTESKSNSSFNMSYIGIGAGTSFTFKRSFFIDGSLNYIKHIDNTFEDVFFSGWDQLSTPTDGQFRSSNFLGSLGVGYKYGKLSVRIGYEDYFKKYEIDSLFGESTSKSDFSFSIGYRI